MIKFVRLTLHCGRLAFSFVACERMNTSVEPADLLPSHSIPAQLQYEQRTYFEPVAN